MDNSAKPNLLGLPLEMSLKICSYLSFNELCNLSLVCKEWNELGEDPWLWRKFPYFVDLRKSTLDLDIVLNIRRFSALESLKISDGFLSKQNNLVIFQFIHSNENIRSIELSYSNFLCVETQSVVDTLSKLEKVTLWNSNMDTDTIGALFQKMMRRTRLKSLSFVNLNLTMVKQGVLSKSLRNLEFVHLIYPKLRSSQIVELRSVLEDETRIKEFSLELPYYRCLGEQSQKSFKIVPSMASASTLQYMIDILVSISPNTTT